MIVITLVGMLIGPIVGGLLGATVGGGIGGVFGMVLGFILGPFLSFLFGLGNKQVTQAEARAAAQARPKLALVKDEDGSS